MRKGKSRLERSVHGPTPTTFPSSSRRSVFGSAGRTRAGVGNSRSHRRSPKGTRPSPSSGAQVGGAQAQQLLAESFEADRLPGTVSGLDPTIAMNLPISILDLAPDRRGSTASDSFAASVELAQRAEELGYRGSGTPSTTTSRRSPRGRQACSSPTSAPDDVHPTGRRRDHAPQPFPARDRGAVRNARGDVPRTDRPRARPGSRLGPEDDVGARRDGARPRHFPRTSSSSRGTSSGPPAWRASMPPPERAPTCRSTSSDRRCSGPAGGSARSSLRVRLALRSGGPPTGRRRLPGGVRALRAARRSLRHRRGERGGSRLQGGGGPTAPGDAARPGSSPSSATAATWTPTRRTPCSDPPRPGRSSRCSSTRPSARRTRCGPTSRPSPSTRAPTSSSRSTSRRARRTGSAPSSCWPTP